MTKAGNCEADQAVATAANRRVSRCWRGALPSPHVFQQSAPSAGLLRNRRRSFRVARDPPRQIRRRASHPRRSRRRARERRPCCGTDRPGVGQPRWGYACTPGDDRLDRKDRDTAADRHGLQVGKVGDCGHLPLNSRSKRHLGHGQGTAFLRRIKKRKGPTHIVTVLRSDGSVIEPSRTNSSP